MSLTRMNVMRAVASGAAPAKRMPPIGTSKRPVARRRLMNSMVGCWLVSRAKVGKLSRPPLMQHFRALRNQRDSSNFYDFRMVSDLKLLWLGPERRQLQIGDEGHHPVALIRIWQAATHCTEIV